MIVLYYTILQLMNGIYFTFSFKFDLVFCSNTRH